MKEETEVNIPEPSDGDGAVSEWQFYEYVKVAAYYLALKRPIDEDPDPVSDWYEAEAAILQQFHLSVIPMDVC